MKRIVLICIVLAAITWISYSSYELWLNTDNTVAPQNVFCKADQSVLLINRLDEIQKTEFNHLIQENPLAVILPTFDSLSFKNLKIYVSGKRPILILEKPGKWKDTDVKDIQSSIKLKGVRYNHLGQFLQISQEYLSCEEPLPTGLILEADKKASANYWKLEQQQWKRTDIYNLDNGFYEYQSSTPHSTYGKAVQDIPLFASVTPYSISSYYFQERFYASQNDSIYKNGPMAQWVDKGFVTVNYEGHQVLISDYRSQQTPRLILNEKSVIEDSIIVLKDMDSYTGFQLTKNFPSKKGARFYVFEIQDKAFFCESKAIARKIMVNYQLGETLVLNPERQKQFFEGLPSHVNMRNISQDQKSSLTWKNNLLFEVNTKPPNEQLSNKEKSLWSASVNHESEDLVPIFDHLRKGTSVLSYDKIGRYELLGPNGNKIWEGDLKAPIQGKVKVIDVFENGKHQFLFHTKRKVYLIDLNGNNVGGFPYHSDQELTSGMSELIWNDTKRFLIGNIKGQVLMLNSAGQELNIVQIGSTTISATPYALNIKGNLGVWAIDTSQKQYLGYLERPLETEPLGEVNAQKFVKNKGKIIGYYAKDGKVYSQLYNLDKDNPTTPKQLGTGEIQKLNSNYIILRNKNQFTVYNHSHNILYSKKLPFNEVSSVHYLPPSETLVVLDYLKNKIHAYNKSGKEWEDFPKEGRNTAYAEYNKRYKTLYIYTIIDQSIICYKYKIS